jgi:hypothetical protein
MIKSYFFSPTKKMTRWLHCNRQLRSAFPCHFLAQKKNLCPNGFIKFKQRHPRLSLRTSHVIFGERATFFTPPNVTKVFGICELLLAQRRLPPRHLSDDACLSVVQHAVRNVSLTDRRLTAALSVVQRGSLVTVITCMSTADHVVPPLLVYRSVIMRARLLDVRPTPS